AWALTLHQAAGLVGAYRWTEDRLFALTGRWAAEPAMTPEAQVHLFEASAGHAWRAEMWAERLPVLDGVDHKALTRPAGPVLAPLLDALEAVGGGDQDGRPGPGLAVARMVGLHRVVLPRLATTYRRHLARAVPVADGPLSRTLRLVLGDLGGEQATGAAVLAHLLAAGTGDAVSVAAERAEREIAACLAGGSDQGDLVPWPGVAGDPAGGPPGRP
ncbi:MAG: hypothetical protein ACRDWN_06870, partial [Acidimicrobiales bacterium]